MPEDPLDAQAAAYFAPPVGACWRWDDRAETLVWRDGTTIAFRSELPSALAPLQIVGLPTSFTAVVLVLAAMRASWAEAADAQLHELKDAAARIAREDPRPLIALGRAVSALREISRIPSERRETTAAKATVLHRTLERQRTPMDPTRSASLLASLVGRLPASALVPRDGDALADLTTACEAIIGARIDAERIALFQDTGLEEMPRAAEVELAPESVRALLSTLGQDDDVGAVVRIARALMAAASLPRPLAAPDELPAGGVSDVSNRGPLHRLLLSELVHDGLTLASRVALGEALYLRRETPPRTDSAVRSILVDSGIRSWGLPRVFAAAAALALAAQAPRRARLRAWRADRDRIAHIDLGSRDGLIEHLGTLATEPHPAAALAAWLDSDADEAVERILILTPAAAEDPALRREIARLSPEEVFVVTVDGAGCFRLRRLPDGTTIREARLDLPALMSTASAQALRATAEHLPSIYRLRPFPLLLPHAISDQRSCVDPDGRVLSATNDGRLMRWRTPGQGATQLTDDLPSGRVLWVGATSSGAALVVVGDRATQRLELIRVTDGGSTHLTLDAPLAAVQAVVQLGDDLLVIGTDHLHVFSGEHGRPLAREARPPDARWRRGRFFCAPSGWYAVSWTGTRLRLDEVCRAGTSDPKGHLALEFFDRAGVDGPWGFTTNGEVVSMSDGSELALLPATGPFTLADVSRDGHRLVVAAATSAKGGARRYLLDLQAKRCQSHRKSYLLEPAYHACAQGVAPLMRSLHGVYRVGGHLCLLTSKRMPLIVSANDAGLVIKPITARGPIPAPANLVRLLPYPAPEGDHRKLLSAVSGRTRIIVDGRGMMHLMPMPDADLVELSFTLEVGRTAGWSSDGSLWGTPRYLGSVVRSQASRLVEHLRRHAEELPT